MSELDCYFIDPSNTQNKNIEWNWNNFYGFRFRGCKHDEVICLFVIIVIFL